MGTICRKRQVVFPLIPFQFQSSRSSPSICKTELDRHTITIMSFPYKKVLVIGATSGIGEALAAKMVDNGVKVIVVSRLNLP